MKRAQAREAVGKTSTRWRPCGISNQPASHSDLIYADTLPATLAAARELLNTAEPEKLFGELAEFPHDLDGSRHGWGDPVVARLTETSDFALDALLSPQPATLYASVPYHDLARRVGEGPRLPLRG